MEEFPIKAKRFEGSNRGLIDSFESEINDHEAPSEQSKKSPSDEQVSSSNNQEDQKQAAPAQGKVRLLNNDGYESLVDVVSDGSSEGSDPFGFSDQSYNPSEDKSDG